MTTMESITKLSRDLKQASTLLSRNEAKFLVDSYYEMQESRKRSGNQVRALDVSGEPHATLGWFFDQSSTLESQVKGALEVWAKNQREGKWLLSITGIGPVISAGLLAHIDIEKSPTVGHIWRFAGLDPTVTWEKGCKRPWNAALRTLCWKIGESFVKVSGNQSDIYGKVWLARKEQEALKNLRGDFKDQAAKGAERVRKTTEAYKHYSQGVLPPGHIHARAKRYAVKLFLAHLHHVMYLCKYNTDPPKPWVIEHGGHVHFIEPPNLDLIVKPRWNSMEQI